MCVFTASVAGWCSVSVYIPWVTEERTRVQERQWPAWASLFKHLKVCRHVVCMPGLRQLRLHNFAHLPAKFSNYPTVISSIHILLNIHTYSIIQSFFLQSSGSLYNPFYDNYIKIRFILKSGPQIFCCLESVFKQQRLPN